MTPTARSITGFHPDDEGDWVAELACGHNQHVRHRPPFQPREWVLDPAGRAEKVGGLLECPLCDRAELPDAVAWVRTTTTWDEQTVPAALRRDHRVGAATWGRITVHEGRLRFQAATTPPIDHELQAGSKQPIPPEIPHHVEPLGSVRFAIDFFAVRRDPPA